jgi:hypothetical protein
MRFIVAYLIPFQRIRNLVKVRGHYGETYRPSGKVLIQSGLSALGESELVIRAHEAFHFILNNRVIDYLYRNSMLWKFLEETGANLFAFRFGAAFTDPIKYVTKTPDTTKRFLIELAVAIGAEVSGAQKPSTGIYRYNFNQNTKPEDCRRCH